MRVVVLARKNVAAMKTGARHLLRSVGVLSPSTGTQFFPSAFANEDQYVPMVLLSHSKINLQLEFFKRIVGSAYILFQKVLCGCLSKIRVEKVSAGSTI